MKEYEVLQSEIDVPEEFFPVLARIASDEESKILIHITKDFLTATTIAEKLNKDEKHVSSVLKGLYQRGFLYKKTIDGKEAYKCKSFYDIIWKHLEEQRYEELGWENLHALRQYHISMRIKKNEDKIKSGQLKYVSKVIPIKKAFTAKQHVLPTQQAIELLKTAKTFALVKCGCRMAFKNCEKPLDTCLLLDEDAEYRLSRGNAKRISLKEAEKVLDIANEAGLVHLSLFMPEMKIYAICSCCSCCCHDLQALLKYGKTFFIAKSDYVATCDTSLCNGCGKCVKRCVFTAREVKNGKSTVDALKCFGCGLCVTSCPTKASELAPRKTSAL